MEYSIVVNQQMCVKYKLSYQHGVLMEFFSKLSTWAVAENFEEGVFYNISFGKIADELPIVFKSSDRAYRFTKELKDKGYVESKKLGKNQKNFIRLTAKGKQVLRVGKNPEASQGSGKIPTRFDKNPEPQKNAESLDIKESVSQGSGKIPTNHNQYTSNQIYIDKSAYEFLQKTATQKLEVWEMQNKKYISNYEKFLEYFEIKVQEEEIEFTVNKLLGRLKRLKFNWQGDFKVIRSNDDQPSIKRKRIG
ncbi:hypothetical protein MHM83_11070 [Tenacibaculum sp. Mcav3-52]|uniref:hypothetical protein n=1 Tax=Tenacibaculum sp. Mcav3-52 TaxID=2917762 RepID=UPI001EF1F8F5|nr:hypothetical protein [Tenacibaculum sp. Mcav3-52]MCG7502414.1 hypothetical protein [Tenacibaculum sp. Mcav3-52]